MKTLQFIWKNLSGIILVFIVLVLFIPSWRMNFQVFFQRLFLSDAIFTENTSIPVKDDFAIFDADDHIQNFQTLKGKPCIVSFWRTWCAPCRAELPEIKKLQEYYEGRIHVLGFTNESFETIEKAGVSETYYSFIRFVPYPSSLFEYQSFPTLFLLNSNLEIIGKHEGTGNLLNEENMALINSLISRPIN